MLHRMRSRMTSAHVISLIALFVALGGTGYAAVKLPKNSVGAAQIKTGGVGSSEVKNGSLKKADFKNSDLPAGPQGPQGPAGTNGTNGTNGAPGPAGSAKAFARVATDGTLQPDPANFPSQVKGIVAGNVVKGEAAAATGTYCFDLDFRPSSALVSLDNADAAAANRNLVASVAIDRGEDLGDCPADHNDARVRIVDGNTETATDVRFFIWFEG
jgi:hypothetical protein